MPERVHEYQTDLVFVKRSARESSSVVARID